MPLRYKQSDSNFLEVLKGAEEREGQARRPACCPIFMNLLILNYLHYLHMDSPI